MVKKIIFISVVAVLLVFGGLTIYVANMDWNAHKHEIAARFSSTFGKKIDFGGNISVSLWPKPHLSAKNVSILNPDTSEKLALVPTMEASLSLRALLQGTPDIESLSLKNAEFWYVVDESGISNWHQDNSINYLDAGIEYKRQTVNLQNGLLHYQNKKYEIEGDIEQFNADIIAESLTGPYRVDGNFVNRGDHYGFAVSAGDVSQSDNIVLNFAVTHPRSNSYILYDGKYNLASGAFSGNFSGEFQKFAELVNSLSKQEILPDIFNLPLVFSVALEADKSTLSMNSLALKFAQLIEGSGNIKVPFNKGNNQVPVVDVQYQFLNLDARPFIMMAQLFFEAIRTEQMPYEPETDFDVNFNIDIQKMVVSENANGVLENVSVAGSWRNNELNVNELYAACPGNIILTMNGSIVSEDKVPNFFAKAHLEGKNIAELVRALGYSLNPINQSTYRNVDISLNAFGNPYLLNLTDMKIAMDKATISGDLVANFSDERTKYHLSGQADIINIDNYFDVSAKTEDIKELIENDIKSLSFLTQADFEVEMSSDMLIFRGVPMKDVALKMHSDEKDIYIENVSIQDVLGANIYSNIVLGNVKNDVPFIGYMKYDIKTENISPIILKLNLNLPQWKIFKNKPMQSTGNISGVLQNVDVKTDTQIGDTRFSFDGKVTSDSTLNFDGKAELKTINFGELVNNLGGNWKKLKNNSSFNCRGDVKGNSADWMFNNAQCILGTAKYSGNISIRQQDDLTNISGNLAVSELDLAILLDVEEKLSSSNEALGNTDDFLARPVFSRDTYKFDSYKSIIADIQLSATRLLWNKKTFTNVVTHLSNNQNKLILDSLQFSHSGGEYQGNIEIDYSKIAEIKGHLDAKNVDLKVIGGKVYKITSGLAQFEGDFRSSATSEADFWANLSGSSAFEVENLGFNGVDFAAIVSDLQSRESSKGLFQIVRDNLQQGNSNFRDVKGNILIDKGTLKLQNVKLENDVVSLLVDGENNMNDWKMTNNFEVKFLTLSDLPSFKYVYSGGINKPDINIDIEKLVQYFDAFEEKIRAEKQAANEEEQRVLSVQMEKVQKEVRNLSAKHSEIVDEIMSYLKSSEQQQYKDWYSQQLAQLKKIGSEIENMKSVGTEQNISEEDITQVEYNCKSFGTQIDKIQEETLLKHQDDLKSQLLSLEKIVEKSKTENSKIYEQYQRDLQKQFSELMEYGNVADIYNDEDIQQMQQKVEDLRQAFWDKSYQMNDIFAQYSSLTGNDDLQDIVKILRTDANELNQNTQQIAKLSADMAERLEAIKEAKKAAFEKEQAQENKVEEQSVNKKSEVEISAKKESNTSVDQKQQPNEQTPSMVNNELQPTLKEIKNTETSSQVSGTIVKSYEETKPVQYIPSTGLLRPIEGEIGKPSGTIIVK